MMWCSGKAVTFLHIDLGLQISTPAVRIKFSCFKRNNNYKKSQQGVDGNRKKTEMKQKYHDQFNSTEHKLLLTIFPFYIKREVE